MADDNGLVDEYEKLQEEKKLIAQKEEELKKRIIELAKEKNTEVLFGARKRCLVKEYEKVVYPEDKTQIINLLKQKGIYYKFSMLNYMGLNSAIIKKSVDKDIINLTKKEKTFRLFIRKL